MEKKNSFNSIRYALNIYYSLSRNVDIIIDPVIQTSQFCKAFTKDLKREGKGSITYYSPIEESDLKKIYEYFDNQNDNVELQQKVFVDIMLYFGRRGRENIHELKISDFAATTDSDVHLFIYMTRAEQTKNHQDDPDTAQGIMYAKKGTYVFFFFF